MGGKVSVPHLVPYSAGKFALVGLSEGFRAELLQHGIQVTTVCPGLMRTGSARNAIIKGQHQKEYATFSIADSLPAVSIDAERAGREIWSACRRGDAEIILGLPAKLLAAFHGLLPAPPPTCSAGLTGPCLARPSTWATSGALATRASRR